MISLRIRRTLNRLSLTGLPVLCLILYLAGTFQVDSLHHFAHPDDHISLHSPEHETDTCHQSIYHAGLNQGCNHPSHLSEEKKCAVCDYANHSVHLFSFAVFKLSSTEHEMVGDHYIAAEQAPFSFYEDSRGPPVL